MSTETTAEAIRDYINESFSSAEEPLGIGVDDDLLQVLDSLQVLRIVMDLEAKYAIKVENSDITPDNFGSAAKLAAYVRRRR